MEFQDSRWTISNPKRWCCESASLNMPANLENSGGHRTGKGQFSFQSQRKAMPMNAQTIIQFCSSQFSSVQSLNHVPLSASPWTAACQASCSSPTPRITQIHIHWVSDAIQPSHPLLSPFLPTFNLSQHQGIFKWVSSSHQVAKGLEFQHQSFQWIFRTDFL